MKKNIRLILVTILLIAAFLRLWRLSEVPVSLFGDELDVGYHAYSILKTGRDYSGNFMPLHFKSLAEWRTPLYLYSAVPTVAVFEITPLGVRLPAAIFGILGVFGIYIFTKELTRREDFSLLAAFLMTISPWHIQYSRAAFEVTQLLAFLVFGLYFFFRSLRESRYLWVSVVLLTFTPWIYSTAKLFTPLLLIFLFLAWKKDILSFPKRSLVKGILAGLIVGLPIAYSTVLGGGAQRAEFTSVFTDLSIEQEVGMSRLRDSTMQKNLYTYNFINFSDRFFHNKVTFWVDAISQNYLQSYSFDFLFHSGDPNLRHSVKGTGQFFKVEVIALILGVIFFFASKIDRKIKAFLVFWLVAGALPAALTRDGGNHATRLILVLPPLILLMAYGILETAAKVKGNLRFVFLTAYCLLLTFCFVFYQHIYWVHNPWDSERWWHAGFQESIQSIKDIERDYDRVIISMSGEPAWIFFAAWYQYPPDYWQANFPIGNDVVVDGFGKISHINKFHFGTFNVDGKSIYDLPSYINEKTLYLANASEVGPNLIADSESTPPGLRLVKAIPYPSGEPAFYLFSKEK